MGAVLAVTVSGEDRPSVVHARGKLDLVPTAHRLPPALEMEFVDVASAGRGAGGAHNAGP